MQYLFFSKQKAGSLNNIGLIYENKGESKKALEYYESGLRLREIIGDKLGVAQSLNNIALV